MSGRRFCCHMLLSLVLALSACASGGRVPADITGGVDAFGVQLGERADHRKLSGVEAEREPCLYGYDYVFDALSLRVGYTREGVVRAVTTRNPANSFYGARVGQSAAEAEGLLKERGFSPGAEPYAYTAGNVRASLMVDGGGLVFGLRTEHLE